MRKGKEKERKAKDEEVKGQGEGGEEGALAPCKAPF